MKHEQMTYLNHETQNFKHFNQITEKNLSKGVITNPDTINSRITDYYKIKFE